MIVGYRRVSTGDQLAGYEAQERELAGAACERIFGEMVSAVGTRPELARCLEFVREGDVLVVTRPDRLARSIAHLVEIVATLDRKRANLRILSMNIDTSSATGKLLLNLLGSIAEFERSLMRERQLIGIAKARADGKYKGRVPTARRQAAAVVELHGQGVLPAEIGRRLGISRASVYRLLPVKVPAAA